MTELIAAPSINTVGGLADDSLFAVTTAAGAVLYQGSGADLKAFLAPTPSLFEQVWHARAANLNAAVAPNTAAADVLLQKGDTYALLFDAYPSGGSGAKLVSSAASVTVPTGKVALLLYAGVGGNVNSAAYGDAYYRARIHNATTGAEYNPTNNPASGSYDPAFSNSGFVVPDSAVSAYAYPKIIGVAGDTINCEAWSAGDSNARTVSAFYVIAMADASTGAYNPG